MYVNKHNLVKIHLLHISILCVRCTTSILSSSKPICNSPTVQITSHYVLLRVSAQFGAIFRVSYLLFELCRNSWLSTLSKRVFYITNEMQLIQCSFLLSALYMFRAGFSAHHQELIKLYVQPWVLSCFPVVYCWCGWVGTALIIIKNIT
jgi:hypothetical protein